MLNSAVVSVTCVISNLVLCSLAGYAFARLRFPGSRLLFIAILATLMVPFQVLMIPTLIIVKHLGLVDTLPALIVPNLVTPFGIYLLRQFFLTLPVELEEAALIDGAGRLRILRSVLLPLMGPPLSTVAVLTFLAVWNDFLWPLVVTSSPSTMTIQLGLATFQSAHFTNWPVLMAATLMSQLPVHDSLPGRTTLLRELDREYGNQVAAGGAPATAGVAFRTAPCLDSVRLPSLT